MVEHREHLGGHIGRGDLGEVLPAAGDQGTERVVTAGSCHDARREQAQPAFQRALASAALARPPAGSRSSGSKPTSRA